MSTMIGVYADWDGLGEPQRLGWLHARRTRGIEKFEYENDPVALKKPALSTVQIGPSIGPYTDAQYPGGGRPMRVSLSLLRNLPPMLLDYRW